jgi:hypothetical protein
MFINGSWPTSTSLARPTAYRRPRRQPVAPSGARSQVRVVGYIDLVAEMWHASRCSSYPASSCVRTSSTAPAMGVITQEHLVTLWFESVYVNNVDGAADSVSVTPGNSIYKTTDPLRYVHTARRHCGGSGQHRSRTTPTATLMSLLLQLTPSTFKGSSPVSWTSSTSWPLSASSPTAACVTLQQPPASPSA